MIIGTSADSKIVNVFRDKEYPCDEIEIDWLNKDSLSDMTNENDEDYYMVGERFFNCVDNGWTTNRNYNSEEVELLIECDYCGKHFTLSVRKRKQKSSKFLRYFNGKTGSQKINNEMIDLYKDNCSDCENLKRKETSMIRNGYWHPSHTLEHRERVAKSFKKHNLVKTSRGQRYISKLFDGELNVLIGHYFVDILLNDNIVIEYDGGGHNLRVLKGDLTQEEFDKRERIRSNFLFSKGYKLIRFISKSEYFPVEKKTKEIIRDGITELLLTDKKEIHIKIGDKANSEKYGKLRPIKKILEESEWGEELL